MRKKNLYPSTIFTQHPLGVVSQLPNSGRDKLFLKEERKKQLAIEWKLKNSEKVKQYKIKYKKIHYKKVQSQIIKYAKTHRDKLNKASRKWAINNPEKIKEWNFKNKAHRAKYVKNKRRTDNIFKLIIDIRSRINKSMKRCGFKKDSSTASILGIDYCNFKTYIENKFTDGMNWSNSGKWHYDHIIPISSAKTKEDVIKLNHYTNFQPLWALDNIKKGKKQIS